MSVATFEGCEGVLAVDLGHGLDLGALEVDVGREKMHGGLVGRVRRAMLPSAFVRPALGQLGRRT
jgi:hypothetical protein